MEKKLEIPDKIFDLVIVGGGIQGAGVARDAALRGLSVILFEQSDYASATSSRSSKLVHGGLRYLERLEFRLVYESLRERQVLLNMAPHLVKPLTLHIPFYKGLGRSSWLFRLGLWLYDFLAGRQPLPSRRFLDAVALRKKFPFLSEIGLKSGASYADCQMDDARLNIETLVDAIRHGALCFNYARVEKVTQETVDGQSQFLVRVQPKEGASQSVRCRTFINASGPWVDQVLGVTSSQAASQPHPQVTHAKGAHLLLQTPTPLAGALLLQVPDEERIFFVLPWHDLWLVGTTDTPFKGDLNQVTADAQDRDYLMRHLRRYLQPQFFASCKVVGSFAGVRPLTYNKGKSTRDISRDYQLIENIPGCISIIGGKYTVFRHIAEKVVDRVCKQLQVQRQCLTARQPLPKTDYHIGDLETWVWAAIRNEHAKHLEDFMCRRSHLCFLADRGVEFLDRVGKIFVESGRLLESEVEEEKKNYRQQTHLI